MSKKFLKLNISKGIALPTREALVDMIPWRDLAVGMSFPVDSALGEKPVERLRMAIHIRHKTTSERFTVRRTNDGTYRCWRIA